MLFSCFARLQWKKAMLIFDGNSFEIQERHREAQNACVT
jgi:hypothetical protein